MTRLDHGSAVANEVARRIVVPPHRSGGQAQYMRPRPTPTGSNLAETLDWARHNLDTVTITAIAARAGTSARTLHRTMTRLTGNSPQQWLQRERIRTAQELLETTTLTVAAIASRTGLGSAANLRSHFAETVGVPPQSVPHDICFAGQLTPTTTPASSITAHNHVGHRALERAHRRRSRTSL